MHVSSSDFGIGPNKVWSKKLVPFSVSLVCSWPEPPVKLSKTSFRNAVLLNTSVDRMLDLPLRLLADANVLVFRINSNFGLI